MTMRYHWGLGVGHTYSHGRDVRSQQYAAPVSGEDPNVAQEEIPEAVHPGQLAAACSADNEPGDVSEPDDQEADKSDVEVIGAEGDSDSATDDDSEADEELLELHDMYNP